MSETVWIVFEITTVIMFLSAWLFENCILLSNFDQGWSGMAAYGRTTSPPVTKLATVGSCHPDKIATGGVIGCLSYVGVA